MGTQMWFLILSMAALVLEATCQESSQQTLSPSSGKLVSAKSGAPNDTDPKDDDELEAKSSIPHHSFALPHFTSSHHHPPAWGNGGGRGGGGASENWFGFQRFVPRSNRISHGRSSVRSFYVLGENKDHRMTTGSDVTESIHNPQYQQQTHHQQYVTFDDDQYGEAQEEPTEEYDHNKLHYETTTAPEHAHSTHQHPPHPYHSTSVSSIPLKVRVVPLKMSSYEVSEALKAMSWIPVPLKLHGAHRAIGDASHAGEDSNYRSSSGHPHYRSMPVMMVNEEDLPRPSSHVATPMDKPLGVVYADDASSDHYTSAFMRLQGSGSTSSSFH